VVIGVPVLAAVVTDVVGSVLSLLLFVNSAHAVRDKVGQGKESQKKERKFGKLRRAFDKYGISGVSLLGQTILPSQVTSAALVSFGAHKQKVILWQIISIILRGTIFGVLAAQGISLMS